MPGMLPPVNGKATVEALIGRGRMLPKAGNAGLVFDRFLAVWDRTFSGEWTLLPKARHEPLRDFCREYEALGRAGHLDLLGAMHDRLDRVLEGLDEPRGESRTWKTRWRVVTGVGNHHPLENGFTFDRSIGVPCLPASAVKGLCRTAASDLLGMPEPELETLFGTQPEVTGRLEEAAAGDLVFLPAWPAKGHWPRLEVDIINNHHPSYTQALERGRAPLPVETDSPVPVFFLVVGAGTPFTFRLCSRTGNLAHVRRGFEALEQGLDLLGIGAKTAVGYGTFAV